MLGGTMDEPGDDPGAQEAADSASVPLASGVSAAAPGDSGAARPWDGLIGDAYRFGTFLQGSIAGMSALVADAFCEADRRVGAGRNPKRFRLTVLAEVRRRAMEAPVVLRDLDDFILAISRGWPEPERSLLALRELAGLSDAELRDLLGLRRSDLDDRLRRLAGRLAVELPQGSAGDGTRAPVSPWRQAISAVEIPAALAEEVASAMDDARKRRCDVRSGLRQPALLVAAFSLLVVLVLAGLAAVEQARRFPGASAVERMVRRAARAVPGAASQRGGVARDIEDWAFLKHGLEGFKVPDPIARWELDCRRVYEDNGHPVVEATLRNEKGAICLFRTDDFRARIRAGGWRYVRGGPWTGAVTERAGICVVLAFDLPERDVRRRVEEIGRD